MPRRRSPRRLWYEDRPTDANGYTIRYCVPCERETEHEGSYCVPCWDREKTDYHGVPSRPSER